MSREEEVNKAKLAVFDVRGFWWVMQDLADLKGPECEIKQFLAELQKRYEFIAQSSLEKPKYSQAKIDYL